MLCRVQGNAAWGEVRLENSHGGSAGEAASPVLWVECVMLRQQGDGLGGHVTGLETLQVGPHPSAQGCVHIRCECGACAVSISCEQLPFS